MEDLKELLELVGELDDAGGDNSPRQRFRKYLGKSVTTPAALRDYVETCIRNSGPQYNRALQDLINHAARLIGFDVEFGRYQGIQGQVGFDGLWRHDSLTIVAEVKTTDAYAIKTATIVGYVDHLISDKRISDWDHALGLYVVGRPDAELKQLENAIIAEKRIDRLRVATVDSILSIAELVHVGYLSTNEAVDLIRPAGALIDSTVGLIARVAAVAAQEETSVRPPAVASQPTAAVGAEQAGALCLLTPVSDREGETAEQVIRRLLDAGWYVFAETTPYRKDLKPGDRMCFYWSTVGVVAEGRVASAPRRMKLPQVKDPEGYPWAFQMKNVRYFFDKPVVIDADLRIRLEAFHGKDPSRPWSWLVQGTRRVSENDFAVLVGAEGR